jgi:L-lactate dehydrogenase complex protein LldG
VNAREEVLGRIRTALGPDRAAPTEVRRDYRLTDERDAAVLLDVLVDRLEDYKATVVHCEPSDVAATVATALRTALGEHDPARVVVAPGVPAGWRPDGAVEDDGCPAVALADYAATVTGVCAAIAETGTLVLDGAAASGRRALTLVPDVHLCVIEAGQVVAAVPDAVARLAEAAAAGRAVTLVSGPSATSDIELDRVEGVHGPRTLEVFVVG